MYEHTATMTLDQFWMQYGYKPYELLHGRIMPLEKLSFRHSIVAMGAAMLLEEFAGKHHLGEVVSALCGFAVAKDTILSPRAAFISKPRWESVKYPYRYFQFAPDISVEVLTDKTDMDDFKRRLRLYLQAGTQQIWCLQPQHTQVTVYIPGGRYRIFREKELLPGGKLLPGLNLPVSALFPRQKQTENPEM